MNKATEKLSPGLLNEESFTHLISFTSIRSEPLIAALKDHLVNGLTKSEAYTKHDVDKTIFSRKLPVIQKVYDKINSFNAAKG